MSINSFIKEAENFKKTMLSVPYNVKDKRVLELGSFVGIHTYALQQMGAKEVIAIEGREENYVKCIKNKLKYDMDKCKFILSNIKDIDFTNLRYFDVCIAFKILHHLDYPYDVIKKISKITDAICMYYRIATEECPQGPSIVANGYKGKRCPEGDNRYSGLQSYSIWLFKEELLRLLKEVGFSNIYIIKEDEEQSFIPNVKCRYIILLASKEKV